MLLDISVSVVRRLEGGIHFELSHNDQNSSYVKQIQWGGGRGGQVVRMLTFYSDDPSLNPKIFLQHHFLYFLP